MRKKPSGGGVAKGYQLARKRQTRVAALAALLALLLLGGLVTPARATAATRLAALGDSLTAGYGLPAGDAFPARLEQALAAQHVVGSEFDDDAVLKRLTGAGIPVLLCGMRAAKNYGADYAAEFDAIYPALAKKYDAALYPFFLDGVTGRPDLTLPDGLHPNAKGVGEIVARILPTVEAFVDKLRNHAAPRP